MVPNMNEADKLTIAINEIERLSTQSRQLRQKVNGLQEELTKWDGIAHKYMAERDDARAQAARLAEALRAWLKIIDSMTTVVGQYLEPDTGVTESIAINDLIEMLDGPTQRAAKTLSNTALISTDSRAWLHEQIAAELERLEVQTKAFQYDSEDTAETVLEVAVPWPIIEARIAELRRKEGT